MILKCEICWVCDLFEAVCDVFSFIFIGEKKRGKESRESKLIESNKFWSRSIFPKIFIVVLCGRILKRCLTKSGGKIYVAGRNLFFLVHVSSLHGYHHAKVSHSFPPATHFSKNKVSNQPRFSPRCRTTAAATEVCVSVSCRVFVSERNFSR